MERTNGYISRRQDALITQQAAKTKEQAATAKELTGWLVKVSASVLMPVNINCQCTRAKGNHEYICAREQLCLS